MSDVIIESKQAIDLGYKVPGVVEPRTQSIKVGVNRVPADVYGALLAQKDSKGVSPMRRYLDADIFRDITPSRAQAIVDGDVPPPSLDLPPAQVAAQEAAELEQRAAKAESPAVKEPPTPRRR